MPAAYRLMIQCIIMMGVYAKMQLQYLLRTDSWAASVKEVETERAKVVVQYSNADEGMFPSCNERRQ
jgi:hypothetical protein